MLIRACSAVALLVLSTLSGVAAECDCKSEVDNASAKTSDSCGKIWKDSHCTLKESTVSDANASSWEPALRELDIQIPITPDAGPLSDFRVQPDPVRLRGVVNVLILNLLSDVAPPEFTSAVLTAMNSKEGVEQIFALTEGNGIARFTDFGEVPIAISRWCIFGGSQSLNFYLNIRPDNELCPVADLEGTLR